MKNRLVKIEWHDAVGGARTGWRSLSEIETNETAKAISVGYVVACDDRSITICPHFVFCDQVDRQGDGEIIIPVSWIERIIDLGELDPYISVSEDAEGEVDYIWGS